MPSIAFPPKEAPVKTLLSIVAVAAAITLTGCAPDKHITEVKALAFSYPRNNFQNPLLTVQDPNLTVDQALDYRHVCDSVKWKVDQTEQHQTFVEYHCTYKGVSDSVFDERDNSHLASAEDVYQWTYNVNGQPELSSVGFTIHFKNGTSKNFNLDATRVMVLASLNKATNFDEAFSYLINTRIPVKPAMPFTDTTYANALAAYYQGHTALDAAKLAYNWKRVPVDIHSIDELGYPALFVGAADAIAPNVLFPVNPADVAFARKINEALINDSGDSLNNTTNPNILADLLHLQPNKLFCLSYICFNSHGYAVGGTPASVLAQEVELGKWVQISAAAPAPTSGKKAADAPDALAAAMASTATTPPAPAPLATSTPAAPVTPQGQTVADATVHSGDVGPDGWPKMTPCIQKLQDKFTADQQKQNADTSSSLEQMQEWADVCKSLGQ